MIRMENPATGIHNRLVFLIVLMLLVAACGGEEAGGGQAAGGEVEEEYPTRPISWIVPYDPGGGSDQQVRRLQPHLQEILGQTINVVYKPGGDGAVGWQELASANPDGYTVGNVVNPNLILLGEDAGFAAEDFSYITWTETAQMGLTVKEGGEFSSLEELIAAAEANPGAVTVAGIGKPSELALAQIIQATGIEVTYVPVSGGAGPIATDLKGGHVDAAMVSSSHVLAQGPGLQALAITGTEPSEALPGVPTFDEMGYEGITIATSWGAMAPPGTPPEIVQILSDAIVQALENEEVRESLISGGLAPMGLTPEEAQAWVSEQIGFIEEASKLLDQG